MYAQDSATPEWLLPLLCCPHCMSSLTLETAALPGVMIAGRTRQRREQGSPQPAEAGWKPAVPGGTTEAGKMPAVTGQPVVRGEAEAIAEALRCPGCGRSYPLVRLGDGAVVPRVRRDDTLATLAQDVVVNRYDPDSAPVAARRRVAWDERRERFLAPLLQNVGRPYAIAAARGDAPPETPSPGEEAMLDRFVALLSPDRPVLDLACGEGKWTRRLAARGRRVVGADASAPSLALAVTPHPAPHMGTLPSPSRSDGEQYGAAGKPTSQVDMRERMPISPLPHGGEGSGVRGEAAFVEADMMEMPFAAASMAGVWCSEAFEYVRPDRRAVFFRQVHRVLRPGGVLFLSAETTSLRAIARQYLLWRVLFGKPVLFDEYIYRLPPKYRSAWHYHAMSTERTLRALCAAHGLRVLVLRRDRWLWLLLAGKEARG